MSDGANGAFQSGVRANLVEVADGFHGGGGQHFAGGRSENDGGDHRSGKPGIQGCGKSDGREGDASSRFDLLTAGSTGCGLFGEAELDAR